MYIVTYVYLIAQTRSPKGAGEAGGSGLRGTAGGGKNAVASGHVCVNVT